MICYAVPFERKLSLKSGGDIIGLLLTKEVVRNTKLHFKQVYAGN